MSSWKTQGAHAAPEPPDETENPLLKPQRGRGGQPSPGLGWPSEGSGRSRPQGPRHQPTGPRAPWPGALHLGASRELGGLPGAGCRPMATSVLRAGLISDNSWGRRAGVLGSVPKSANEGGKLRSPRWGGLGARGPLTAGTLPRVLSCLPAWPGRAATRWTVGEGLACPSARLQPPEQNYLANIPGLPDS